MKIVIFNIILKLDLNGNFGTSFYLFIIATIDFIDYFLFWSWRKINTKIINRAKLKSNWKLSLKMWLIILYSPREINLPGKVLTKMIDIWKNAKQIVLNTISILKAEGNREEMTIEELPLIAINSIWKNVLKKIKLELTRLWLKEYQSRIKVSTRKNHAIHWLLARKLKIGRKLVKNCLKILQGNSILPCSREYWESSSKITRKAGWKKNNLKKHYLNCMTEKIGRKVSAKRKRKAKDIKHFQINFFDLCIKITPKAKLWWKKERWAAKMRKSKREFYRDKVLSTK